MEKTILPQKILMITQSPFIRDVRVRREAEALRDRGHRVDVIALKSDCDICGQLPGIHVTEINLSKKRGNVLRYLFEYAAFFVLASGIVLYRHLRHQYDVCHVHNMPDFHVFTALIPKLSGAVVILDLHDPMPELFAMKFNLEEQSFIYKMLVLQERWSIGFSHHLITVSQQVKENLTERGIPAGKITLIHNLPDHRLFRRELYAVPDHRPERFEILFAGTLSNRSGLMNVIRALPKIQKKIPGIFLHLMGEGDYAHTLKSEIQRLGLKECTLIESFVPLEEVPAAILRADAVAWLPDRNSFIDLCLPLKVLEAVFMGIPVIATRTPCLEAYLKSSEICLIDDTRPEIIAEAVGSIWNQDEKGSFAKTFRKRFNWQEEQQKLFALMEN